MLNLQMNWIFIAALSSVDDSIMMQHSLEHAVARICASVVCILSIRNS
jgi:hypothetical protein